MGCLYTSYTCARQRFLARDFSRITRDRKVTKKIGVIFFITYSFLAFVAVVRLPYSQFHFLIDHAFNALLCASIVSFLSTVSLQGGRWGCLGVQFASRTCNQYAFWLSFHSARPLLAISLTAVCTLPFEFCYGLFTFHFSYFFCRKHVFLPIPHLILCIDFLPLKNQRAI